MPETKICSQCSAKLPIDDFHFENKELGTRRANCRNCKSTASKKSYEDSRNDPESVARRIIKSCKEREKARLAKFIKRRDELDYLPDVELTSEQFDIDVEWMLAQRVIQGNKCFYTGIEMIWSTGLIGINKRINPQAVTIERVNSLEPYIKSNCVLSCWWSNCAKNSGSIEELVEFSFSIVRKYKQDNKLKSLDKLIKNNKRLFIK